MGLFSGFLDRRRQRESAVQPGNEMTSSPPSPSEEVKPVGQPYAGAGQPVNPFDMGGGNDIFGVLGMIKDAYQSGNMQISHGSSQMIDLRGDTNADELREQIMAAMQERGIDPNATPEQATQIDASQYAGLQEDLLRVLGEHGIDVNGPGAQTGMPDVDGDGKPG